MRSLTSLAFGIALAICGITTGSATARADDPKRPVPDYDGRPPPPATPGEVALWVPRIILFPPYLVSEYIVRRPLGALITAAERGNWATTLVNVFTFGPDHNAGIVPTAFADFGMRSSVGIYFFWDRAFHPKNDLRAHVSYFGSAFVALALTDRVHISKDSTFSLNTAFVRRPDQLYYGEGPNAPKATTTRYQIEQLEFFSDYLLHPSPSFYLDAKIGLRFAHFNDREFSGDPSVFQGVAAGFFALPTDYTTGYTDGYQRLGAALDSRNGSETGIRLAGHVEHASNLRPALASSWMKYGGSLAGFVDVWRKRVFGLTLDTEFATPIRDSQIPFTEEVVWGGNEPLTGFRLGRLHGRSAASATFSYAWPIWVWLDGTMRASFGNVFDAGLRDFSAKLLRFSTAIGVQSNGSPDHRFEMLFGVATETFEQGGKLDSFRLLIGGTNGL